MASAVRDHLPAVVRAPGEVVVLAAEGAFDKRRRVPRGGDAGVQRLGLVPQDVAALAEARRVLVPGGRVVLVGQDWEALVVDADDAALTRTIVHARAGLVPAPRAASAVCCWTPGCARSPRRRTPPCSPGPRRCR
ncbi:hypothetical protein ACFW95_24200 [Streptomyces sp. NPDC059474]|uniref:hypothetical protein n=1 Tax=Streptomyces sp. NPDC059474 TaxID=3346846 RepID=UPI0036775E2A